MACPDIIDIEKAECLNNVGGLELSLSVWQSKDREKMVGDKTLTWTYTALEFSDGASPTPALITPVTISYHKKTANLMQSAEGDEATANSTNVVTLSVTINAQEYLKSKAISIMSAGQRNLDVALAYKNGTKWFLPDMILKGVVADSGTESVNGSNYVLTFTAEYDSLALGIEDADFETLVSTGKFGAA